MDLNKMRRTWKRGCKLFAPYVKVSDPDEAFKSLMSGKTIEVQNESGDMLKIRAENLFNALEKWSENEHSDLYEQYQAGDISNEIAIAFVEMVVFGELRYSEGLPMKGITEDVKKYRLDNTSDYYIFTGKIGPIKEKILVSRFMGHPADSLIGMVYSDRVEILNVKTSEVVELC